MSLWGALGLWCVVAAIAAGLWWAIASELANRSDGGDDDFAV